MKVLFLLLLLSLSCKENQRESDKTLKTSSDSLPELQNNGSNKTTYEAKEIPPVTNEENISKLKKGTHIETDKFTNNSWVYPNNKPTYVNQNAIYAYFPIKGNNPNALRLKIQYVADDWLFIKSYVFNIDGQIFTYIPDEIKTDNGDGLIWEWSDNPIINENTPLIEALAKAKSAKIRFEGRDYNRDKVITPMQLKNIRVIYNLFIAMGGTFNY